MKKSERYKDQEGAVVECRLAVDTWREVTVGIVVTSADGESHREIELIVKRKGCARNTYFSEGRCIEFCPTFFYNQDFNWRCGKCNKDCEFCKGWNRCDRCRRDTALRSYMKSPKNDGSCVAQRIHEYKVYYDLARYFAIACASLMALYTCGCIIWAGKHVCWHDVHDSRMATGSGFRGSYGGDAASHAHRGLFRPRAPPSYDTDWAEGVDVE